MLAKQIMYSIAVGAAATAGTAFMFPALGWLAFAGVGLGGFSLSMIAQKTYDKFRRPAPAVTTSQQTPASQTTEATNANPSSINALSTAIEPRQARDSSSPVATPTDPEFDGSTVPVSAPAATPAPAATEPTTVEPQATPNTQATRSKSPSPAPAVEAEKASKKAANKKTKKAAEKPAEREISPMPTPVLRMGTRRSNRLQHIEPAELSLEAALDKGSRKRKRNAAR